MTAQRPEGFKNLHPDFSVGEQRLFFVRVGADPESRREYVPQKLPQESEVKCSALRRGHVRHYTLHPDGRLELCRYSYPLSDQDGQEISEFLEGDFWMIFRHQFFGPSTRVPFVDGHVVLDQEKWHVA